MSRRVAKPVKPDPILQPDLARDLVKSRVQSAVWDYDQAVDQVEKTWGVDRLPYIVSDATRLKWWRAVDALNEAIKDGNAEKVRSLVDNLIRGLDKLIAEAKAAGHKPLSPDIWETPMADGTTLRIVRVYPENAAHFDDGRTVRTFTIEEIARLVESLPGITATKAHFPHAVVTKARTKTEEMIDDEIPF